MISQLKALARLNLEKFNKINQSEWKQNGEIKGAANPCKIYTIDVENRVASKGVVDKIEGNLEEFYQLLHD